MTKKVDEDWKRQAAQDKEKLAEETPQEEVFPEASFSAFLNSLATQTLVALGEIENPISKTKELNLLQAKYTIDLLQILQEKTKGNLAEEEEKFLEAILYDLRMRYVEACN